MTSDEPDMLQVCPFCGEELNAELLKCIHCGEFLSENARLLTDLKEVEPDPELLAKLPEWPDKQLMDALEIYADDYEPSQVKALAIELDRRTVAQGRRAEPAPGWTFSDTGGKPLHSNGGCGAGLLLPGLILLGVGVSQATPVPGVFGLVLAVSGAVILVRSLGED